MRNGQDSNLRRELRIKIVVSIAVLFITGICVLAASEISKSRAPSRKLFKEAVALRDQGKYKGSIDKYLEIPEKYSVSFSDRERDLNELLGEFPEEQIFEIAADLRERFKEDKEDFVIETAIELYEYLIETYPEVAVRAEAEKIGAEIEEIGEPRGALFRKIGTAKALNGKSEVAVSHDAGGDIEVLFSGPSPKRVKIAKGKTGTALLTPGDYTIGVKGGPLVISSSYTATFKANRSYEHELRFETIPSM